jgi:dihydropteroate synthase
MAPGVRRLEGLCGRADGVLYIEPLNPAASDAGESVALALAGGRLVFRRARVTRRLGGQPIAEAVVDAGDFAEAAGNLAQRGDRRLRERLDAITRPRAPIAGLGLDRPRVIGIVNVTPDSFSDGGDHVDPAAAIAHGHDLVAAGADMLDIGGESTRPGAQAVNLAEEMKRVLPVIEGLRSCGAPLSIDTRKAAVMRAAVAAGVSLVNDVSALTHDAQSMATVAELGTPVVLMHMRGEPATMQKDPRYADVRLDVHDELEARVKACQAAGIAAERIVVDPGLGFGKRFEDNMRLLGSLTMLHGLGCALMVGASRKRFLGQVTGVERPKQRLGASLAAALWAAERGAHFVRAHDVAATAQALAMWRQMALDER